VRKWSQSHRSLARVQLFPVLPVVFYTGLRRWPEVGTLVDLMERGEEFRAVTSIIERPLFLNLPELPARQLEHEGGYFGWVLQLFQQRKQRVGEFEELVERVITHLESMLPAEHQRLFELISYIDALIYHERNQREQARLRETVERSIQNEELRQEVFEMGKTMADVLMERGRTEGERKGRTEGRTEAAIETRQQTLVRQLHRRFGDVPASAVSAVEATTDVDQLDTWLDRLVTARTLDELEIPMAR